MVESTPKLVDLVAEAVVVDDTEEEEGTKEGKSTESPRTPEEYSSKEKQMRLAGMCFKHTQISRYRGSFKIKWKP